MTWQRKQHCNTSNKGTLSRLSAIFTALKKDEKGVTAVELALNLPVFLAVIIMIIEFSRMAYTKSALAFAAEEATRYSLVNYDATTEELVAKARESLVGVDLANLRAIVVTAPTDADDQTKLVTVTITYQYTPILPVGYFLGGDEAGFSLTGESKGFLTEEIPSL